MPRKFGNRTTLHTQSESGLQSLRVRPKDGKAGSIRLLNVMGRHVALEGIHGHTAQNSVPCAKEQGLGGELGSQNQKPLRKAVENVH